MGYSKKGAFYKRPGRLQKYPDTEESRWCTACKQYKYKIDFSPLSRRCKPCLRGQHWRNAYGLSKAELAILNEVELCHICGGRGNIKRLSVDHDHETGKIRGLLCFHCNQAVGLLKDSPDLAANVYSYLTDPPFNVYGISVNMEKYQRFLTTSTRYRKGGQDYYYVPKSEKEDKI